MRTLRLIFSLSVIMSLSFIFVSCADGQTHQHEDHNHHDQGNDSDETITSVQEVSQELSQRLLEQYLLVKDALVQTKGDAASEAALVLSTLIGETQNETLTDILTDAKHIAESQDPSHQRDHFNTLSDNMYTLVKGTGANEEPIYLQFCPMAFDNKGAHWLAAEKEVNNPYFGDMMLHCGAVKETLD